MDAYITFLRAICYEAFPAVLPGAASPGPQFPSIDNQPDNQYLKGAGNSGP